MNDAVLPRERSGSPLPWVFLGGLVAGVLDITYAFVILGFRGRSPAWVLQSVASGLLGAAAFQGGAGTALLGTLCHFFIACTASFAYYTVSRWATPLVRYAVVCGLLYGVVVHTIMNFVVMPLSAIGRSPAFTATTYARDVFFHMVLIGLPIGLATARASRA